MNIRKENSEHKRQSKANESKRSRGTMEGIGQAEGKGRGGGMQGSGGGGREEGGNGDCENGAFATLNVAGGPRGHRCYLPVRQVAVGLVSPPLSC